MQIARETTKFLSTPSGWRATALYPAVDIEQEISIHALRVEGDIERGKIRITVLEISIHALRVEGDLHLLTASSGQYKFLSTPSGWRAT